MPTLLQDLEAHVAAAFAAEGQDPAFGRVEPSSRPELGQFQCNGVMQAAKAQKRPPRPLAEAIAARLRDDALFEKVDLAGPGFLNLTLRPGTFATRLAAALADPARLGVDRYTKETRVVLDFGGANIAKAMHVGHLRSLIIGDCLQRTLRFLGVETVSDVHLGDWGLQMGMLIDELRRREPSMPYFDASFTGPYPAESPVTLDDLQRLYPAAAERCKADAASMDAAREATRELQAGRPGYLALWRHFVAASRASLEAEFDWLGVHFDRWDGESTVNDVVPRLVERLTAAGLAVRSEGALVVHVERPDDKKPVPPLLLLKSDGAMLYGTTDLATILHRLETLAPSRVLYVVDQRQGDHFEQVFRAAALAGFTATTGYEHIGFGTVNGPDGKPFKTRAGGTMRLADLLSMAKQEALSVLAAAELAVDFGEAERDDVAHKVGIAAIKFADLQNHRQSDYVFDLARFTKFEGKTGPYILYAAVRTKSLLRKAEAQGFSAGALLPPASPFELNLMLQLALFGDAVTRTYEQRAPSVLCDYVYTLAQELNRFWHECPVLAEPDAARRASYLALVTHTGRVLEKALDLLGIGVPARM